MSTICPNGDVASTVGYTKVWNSEAAAFWLGYFGAWAHFGIYIPFDPIHFPCQVIQCEPHNIFLICPFLLKSSKTSITYNEEP